MRRFASFLLFLVLLGCSSVTREQAESSAIAFVNEHVVTFTKENETRDTVPDFSVRTISAEQIGDAWQVTLNIKAQVNGAEKQNTATVTVDARSGRVTHFNNMLVPGP
jgi:hypothetical protein